MQRAFIGVGADAAESEARRAKNTEKIAFLLKRRFYEMAARGKPQLNTCFFEILIYTLYILTSRFLSNSKPKNAHSMGKKQACFTLKLFQQLFFNASNLRKLAFVLYHLKSCFPTVFISNISLRTKILKCTDLFKILVHFFIKERRRFYPTSWLN